MKKKSLVVMMGAVTLVGAIGVGATLAYMTDASGEVRNTFTFAENGIDISLDEAVIDENNKAVDHDNYRTTEGQDYTNILPGMELDKDPTVTVTASSLNCNIFVSVENANDEDYLKISDFNTSAWAKVNPADYGLAAVADTTYYVYQGTKATGTIEANDVFKVVPTSATDTALEDVFETLLVGEDITESVAFSDIVIKAAAVQADNCSDIDAATTALGMLGATVAAQ